MPQSAGSARLWQVRSATARWWAQAPNAARLRYACSCAHGARRRARARSAARTAGACAAASAQSVAAGVRGAAPRLLLAAARQQRLPAGAGAAVARIRRRSGQHRRRRGGRRSCSSGGASRAQRLLHRQRAERVCQARRQAAHQARPFCGGCAHSRLACALTAAFCRARAQPFVPRGGGHGAAVRRAHPGGAFRRCGRRGGRGKRDAAAAACASAAPGAGSTATARRARGAHAHSLA